MKQFLIIPDKNDLKESLELVQKYSLGFEYNDFFKPDVLDDKTKLQEMIEAYKVLSLPSYCTMHGAFFDVLPFSVDAKIREISVLRIEQSIQAAEQIGAKAVVFHTNYNPFLNDKEYVKNWIEENVMIWGNILEKYPEINIYLENMFDTTPDIMEALSEKLCQYKNYGVCLDYAHASLSAVAPTEWAKRLGKYVKHVHINDNDLISDLHLAWGDGQINRQNFYDCYEKYMKDVSVLVETSSLKNVKRSLEVLEKEGFLERPKC